MDHKKELVKQYYELEKGDQESTNDEQYDEAKKTVSDIIEAEEVAEKILKVGNMWKYENKPIPGHNEKADMDQHTFNCLKGVLNKDISDLDDASLEGDIEGIRTEIKKAKEFLADTKPSLAAFTNG